MYVGTSRGTTLWQSFDIVVTVSTVFRQQGTSPAQISFCQLLSNLRNATPTIDDWKLLMTRSKTNLPEAELQ